MLTVDRSTVLTVLLIYLLCTENVFFSRMLERDVGMYEAVASNEHGEARQRVRMDIAEYPVFVRRPEEAIIMVRKSGRLEARVTGVPYPELKWYKDWQPLYASSRIKVMMISLQILIEWLVDE